MNRGGSASPSQPPGAVQYAHHRETEEQKNLNLYDEHHTAEIVHCYASAGTILRASTPVLEVRLEDSPLQTLTYGESQSVVVRRILSAAARPIEVLSASIPLAVVETVQEGAAQAPEALLIVSISREGNYRALLILATLREDERALVLEVAPAQLTSSRLPPRYRAALSRPRFFLDAGPGWSRRGRR